MPTLSEIRDIIDRGKHLSYKNRIHISTNDYNKISDFLSDVTKLVAATEVSTEKVDKLFKERPYWQWVFAFVKQELQDCRNCLRYKGSLKGEKVICGEISIHLNNLETHLPQIEGIGMEETDLKALITRLVGSSAQSPSTTTSSSSETDHWPSL